MVERKLISERTKWRKKKWSKKPDFKKHLENKRKWKALPFHKVSGESASSRRIFAMIFVIKCKIFNVHSFLRYISKSKDLLDDIFSIYAVQNWRKVFSVEKFQSIQFSHNVKMWTNYKGIFLILLLIWWVQKYPKSSMLLRWFDHTHKKKKKSKIFKTRK